MNAGFALYGSDPIAFVFADRLVRSIREHMPDVRITQLTDERTVALCNVDEVRRRAAGSLSFFRSAHYAELSGDWLLVDTDVVVERDVRPVFNESFDVAMTDRDWPHLAALPESFTNRMPYCAGVTFSRSPQFWSEVHERVAQMSPQDEDRDWYGDQIAMADLIRENRFESRILPGRVYQYPPKAESDDLCDVAITHYKGPERKRFLMRRIHREYGLC